MKKIALLITAVVAFGCTDAEQSKMGGLGDKFSVELVNCDGTITHKWISSGKVLSEAKSDGYYFMEDKTGKLVEVTGTLIITKQ
jgi:hypothetical protein